HKGFALASSDQRQRDDQEEWHRSHVLVPLPWVSGLTRSNPVASSRIRKALALPSAAQPDRVVPGIDLGLDQPTFEWSGKDEVDDDADGSAGDDTLRMVLAGLDAAIGDEGRRRVGGDTVLPAIALAHELCSGEGNRRMPRRKRMGATIGARLVDRVLERVG